jgi:NADP-dependent 3-hydroxy acid dehydrogenase YdfG
MKVKFPKWVYIDDKADLSLSPSEDASLHQFKVEVRGMPVLTAELLFNEPSSTVAKGAANSPAHPPFVPIAAARDLSLAELKGRSGEAYTSPALGAADLFPHLAASITGTAVADLAACSYVVGMEAPGLHSMLSKLDITIDLSVGSVSDGATLHYDVISLDERFRKAKIHVEGRSISGILEAFIRVPPVDQASMAVVSAHVEPSEFVGMKALIIGGSRGLGELTAKLIAAGGGTPTITYAVGKVDAERVADQIRAAGGKVQLMAYDVCQPAAPQLAAMGTPVTHLFYFATNAIFRPKGELLSAQILGDFTTFYLQGFYDLCIQLRQKHEPYALDEGTLVVYYPSSIAVEERPPGMTEYAMVKAAGEQLCRDMNQYVSGLQIITTRLPRLRTDQTATVIPSREIDAIEVMLPIIREMKSLG